MDLTGGDKREAYPKNIDYLLDSRSRIESKWLGVIWDSANLAPVADPYKEVERIEPYSVTAQVKVMTKVQGKDVPAELQVGPLRRRGVTRWRSRAESWWSVPSTW